MSAALNTPNCRRVASRFVSAMVAFCVVILPEASQACSVCYGKSDSPLAVGMNWGIFSLLGVILFVLGSVAGFFVFLARRAAALSVASGVAQPASSDSTGTV